MPEDDRDRGNTLSVAGGTMPFQLPNSARQVIGVAFSVDAGTVSAAVVTADGHGMVLWPEVADHAVVKLPTHVVDRHRQLQEPTGRASARDMAQLSWQLAELSETAIRQLHCPSNHSPQGPLAVAVADPGIWTCVVDEPPRYFATMDPAWLAEATGLNVIDALPSRDVAQQGRGGPLTAMGKWFLLANRGLTPGGGAACALVELNETVRLTYLPRAPLHNVTSPLLSFDVGPAMNLVDPLTTALRDGRESSDLRGTLAVQGRRIPELLQSWLDDETLANPHWRPQGVTANSLLESGRNLALQHGWSLRDLLCTATHFIAASLARAVRERLPKAAPVGELILAGRGRQNGFLLREIGARLPEVPLRTITTLGVADEALEAGAVGVLALLYIDQVPANPTSLTGAKTSRILGRLTPGAPASWNRLLREMAQREPPMMTLRSAI